MKKVNLGQCTPTSCPKAGIKIHESNNNYTKNPFSSEARGEARGEAVKQSVNTLNSQMEMLDLNLANYELKDIFKLFAINPKQSLTDEVMKEAKKVVLKIHPDKSQLDPKFFIFYSSAYKKLFEVYEFQNKSTNKSQKDTTYQTVISEMNEGNKTILNNLFQNNKDLKEAKNFNSWFNERFDKYKVDDDLQNGYGDWLKSNEDLIDTPSEQVTQTNMNQVFEKKKKELQELSVYRGVQNLNTKLGTFFGGSSLDGDVDNYTTDTYTDLKQAYTETVIPVTEEDFRNMKTYKSVDEYNRSRDMSLRETRVLSKGEAQQMLDSQHRQDNLHSQEVAYRWAQQMERAKTSNDMFWQDLKQIKY